MDSSPDSPEPIKSDALNSDNQSTIVPDMSGEVRIQIEGSHTTDSGTENENTNDRTYVKFEDKSKEHQSITDQSSSMESHIETSQTNEVVPSWNRIPHNLWSPDDISGRNSKPKKIKCAALKPDQIEESRQIEKDHKEITERFNQIMDMFDLFTRNLETLDLHSIAGTTVSTNFEAMNNVERYSNDAGELQDHHTQNKEKESCSICTATSGPNLNSQVEQSAFGENISIGPSSLITLSRCTSRSEMPQSLNNYTNTDNALQRLTSAKSHPLKELSADLPHIVNPAPLVATEDSGNQTFHTINIDAASSPSSSQLHRPPLCQRLWDALTDFCAAICMCLQVNRDSIFCLGFFAAFVVSASFLTAFFYRTLSVSSPLLLLPPTLGRIVDKKN